MAQNLNDPVKVAQAINQLQNRVTQLKYSIHELLMSFEMHNTKVSYQDTVNKYAAIAAELVGIQTALKKSMLPNHIEDYGQLLKSNVVTPKLIAVVPDLELQKATEGRMDVCNQDVIQQLLRTRLAPEIEEEERKYETERSNRPVEQTLKQISAFNKHLDALAGRLGDMTRQSTIGERLPAAYSTRDTEVLVRAMCRGTGIVFKSAAAAAASATNTSGDSAAVAQQASSSAPAPVHPAINKR